MKVVVVGGSGMIGSRIVAHVARAGQAAVAASRGSGVDLISGAGLDAALAGAQVVIDASNPPRSADRERFFADATANLLAAATRARVRHVVPVSIVGVDRLVEGPYFRGKIAQEALVRASGLPFTIVRCTQFTEFIDTFADPYTHEGAVRLPAIMVQPIGVDDAAAAVVRIALGSPRNGMVEIAGAAPQRLEELVARTLAAANDPRPVVSDPSVRYFGVQVTESSLLPSG